jgi:hypothetical protein
MVRVAFPPVTLTRFRNGDQNLHYLHDNKTERGRTCRACHEVHAAKQKHQIRDAVPYGPKGWMLKVNFTQTPTGGSCAKTCYETRSYTNSVAALRALPPSVPSASSCKICFPLPAFRPTCSLQVPWCVFRCLEV